MQLPGARNQPYLDELLDFSGTIGTTAALLLPQQPGRSFFLFENISASNIIIDFGPATATATISGGAVTSVGSISTNMSYTVAPQVVFLGGLVAGDYRNAPSNVAQAVATLSGGSVNAITLVSGGSGYVVAPYVMLLNPLPTLGGGARTPSATSGIVVPANTTVKFDATFCPTGACAIVGVAASLAYTCKVYAP